MTKSDIRRILGRFLDEQSTVMRGYVLRGIDEALGPDAKENLIDTFDEMLDRFSSEIFDAESNRKHTCTVSVGEVMSMTDNDELRDRIRELEALVKDIYADYWAAYYSGVGENYDKENLAKIERRMKELGIEVSE